MANFRVDQMLEHTGIPEMGRVKVEFVSEDMVRVFAQNQDGGEVRTFKLPNAFLRLAVDQTTNGFNFAKRAKIRGKAKAAKGAPAAPKIPPQGKPAQKFHFFGKRG